MVEMLKLKEVKEEEVKAVEEMRYDGSWMISGYDSFKDLVEDYEEDKDKLVEVKLGFETYSYYLGEDSDRDHNLYRVRKKEVE